MKKFKFFILCLVLTMGINLPAQNSPIKENEIVKNVVMAIKQDNVSDEDLRKWYAIYRGMSLYITEFDANDVSEFNSIFIKSRMIRDKLAPTKGNTNLIQYTESVLAKYKTMNFSENDLSTLAEELNYMAVGMEQALNE